MTVSAVIPLRFVDCCLADGDPRMVLSGQPLWQITLKQALESKRLDSVIVAYDDDKLVPVLSEWAGQIQLCQRPPHLSDAGVTTLDVMAHVAGTLSDEAPPDNLMLLEITHPLRPKGIIDQMVEAVDGLDVDSLITCHRVNYNFWRQDEAGAASRIRGAEGGGKTSLYQELVGICSLFKTINLNTETPFGDIVDIVPIDKFWATIDVRDEDGLWLAEQYLERSGVTL